MSDAVARPRRRPSYWIIFGVAYSVLLPVVSIWLLGHAEAEDWRGPASAALTVLTWGLHPWEFLPIVFVAAVLDRITGGASDGIIQGYISAFVIYMAIAAAQVGLLRLVTFGVRRAVRGAAARRG